MTYRALIPHACRRRFLVADLVLAAFFAAAGCGGLSPIVTGDLGAQASPDLGPRSTFSESEAQSARESCAFEHGAFPGSTLSRSAPLGAQIPIETVVVVMMENRSFDHLLGNLPAAGQTDAEVAPGNAANPDANGNPVARYHDTDLCFADTNHEWSGSHQQFGGGKMDGFVVTNQGASGDAVGKRAMSYYTQDDVPFLYGIATTFSLADHYFCSLLGPTYPNRDYLYAATSFGLTDNFIVKEPRLSIFDELQAAGIDFHIYWQTVPGVGILLDTFGRYLSAMHIDRLSDFYRDAEAGTLAPVVFVDPDLKDNQGGLNSDYHPPGDVQLGDQFLEKVVTALMRSPQWPHTAIFVTFDEHGGLYDHMPPPRSCPPDDIAPVLAPGDPVAGFDRYGFRVPMIVVSPYAKPHFVSHKVYSHPSILRFIESRFVLPALTASDANADPMFDLFDFGKAALLTPPPLPSVTVDEQKLAACKLRFPAAQGGGP